MSISPVLRELSEQLLELDRDSQNKMSQDTLTSAEKKCISENLEQTNYSLIGAGTDRIVITKGQGQVIKLARPTYGPFSGKKANKVEYKVFTQSDKKRRELLAPVFDVSEQGTWLIMEQATECIGREYEIPSDFYKRCERANIDPNIDMLVWNLGYVPSREKAVFIDYGNELFIP